MATDETGADEYERKYMGEGGIAYQAKAKSPALFHLIVLFPVLLSALILGVTTAVTPGAPPWLPLMALPSLLLMLPIWLLFSVLRATVTSTHVHVQYGLFGPRIPIAKIESCEAVSYDWKQYGGWGIRRGRDGSWAYNMMGDQGRAVKLVWRDDRGNTTTTLVSATDPDAFVRAVANVKGTAAAPKVRIGRAGPSAAELAEAEREMEAVLEAEASEGATHQARTTE